MCQVQYSHKARQSISGTLKRINVSLPGSRSNTTMPIVGVMFWPALKGKGTNTKDSLSITIVNR